MLCACATTFSPHPNRGFGRTRRRGSVVAADIVASGHLILVELRWRDLRARTNWPCSNRGWFGGGDATKQKYAKNPRHKTKPRNVVAQHLPRYRAPRQQVLAEPARGGQNLHRPSFIRTRPALEC
eukprot:3053274-Prymnesium_polylepis.1